MKVICVNDSGSRTLLKGHIYEVKEIKDKLKKYNYVNGQKTYISEETDEYVNLFKVGRQKKYRFTKLDGTKLDGIDFTCNVVRSKKVTYLPTLVQNGEIKAGDTIECRTRKLKSVDQGELYKIEEIISEQGTRYGRTYTDYYFKLEGVDRKLKVNWNFKLPDKQKIRKDKILDIFGEKKEKKPEVDLLEVIQLLSDLQRCRNTIKEYQYDIDPLEFLIRKYGYDEEYVNKIKQLKIKNIINI